jgi:N utilization substance protein A
MTEAESPEKRQKEFAERSKMFEEELDVDETLSQLLVAEGFSELEEVAYVELAELAAIEGFDEELAEELQSRATEALERREEAAARSAALGVEDALAELPHLTEAMLVTLGKAGIKTLDDLADLATDELIAKKRAEQRRRDNSRPRRRIAAREDKGGVLGEYGLSEEQGNEIIMAARAHWFEDEGWKRLFLTGWAWKQGQGTLSWVPRKSMQHPAAARSGFCSTHRTQAPTAAASATRAWRVGEDAEGSARAA